MDDDNERWLAYEELGFHVRGNQLIHLRRTVDGKKLTEYGVQPVSPAVQRLYDAWRKLLERSI